MESENVVEESTPNCRWQHDGYSSLHEPLATTCKNHKKNDTYVHDMYSPSY